MLLAIALTYLDDEENAGQAYDQALRLEIRDPSICLNYAIFLYNQDAMEDAKRMINEFEARVVKFRQSTGADLDTEILENGAKLAALLGVDGTVFRKRTSRTRLEAPDESLPPEKSVPSNVNQDVEDGPPGPAEAPEDPQEIGEKSLLVPPTENPEPDEAPEPSGNEPSPEEKEDGEEDYDFGREDEDLV